MDLLSKSIFVLLNLCFFSGNFIAELYFFLFRILIEAHIIYVIINRHFIIFVKHFTLRLPASAGGENFIIENNNNNPVITPNAISWIYVIISGVLKLFLKILKQSKIIPIKKPFNIKAIKI